MAMALTSALRRQNPRVLSISVGPLALPVGPLLLIGTVWLAAAVARRGAGSAHAETAETAIWAAALVGLAASRIAQVALHARDYLAAPWSIVDIRDGGWQPAVGFAAAALWLGWRAWRHRALTMALARAGFAGAALWTFGTLGLFAAAGGTARAPVPAIELVDLSTGQTKPLSQVIAGRPAVVNLWASWCGPCRVEMPVLAAGQRQNPDIAFAFVNQGESPEAVRAWMAREGLRLENVWLDRRSALLPALGSSGLPTTVFYDREGLRVDAHFGVINAAALGSRLRKLRD
jgi:thiol-disulfide isomerase/thioredoxin